MIGKRGIALTQVGTCCNPECGVPLYKELMVFWDDEACLDCNPPREGLPTAFRMLAESLGVDITGKTDAEVLEALGFHTPPPRSSGHFSEDCCRGGEG
jgi:NADH:ubiquinone oxidoreductase subunit F (NADH-binding)